MEILHPNDTLTRIEINSPQRYLLLPIEESQPEVQVRLVGDRPEDTWLDIRLAVDSIDYYVPLALPEGKSPATVEIIGLDRTAISYEKIQLADTFDTSAKDYYRPAYHHSPTYGWMNDPNGMIYKDGVYHLYYQYNPYGLKWGNMYWGHSSSRDLIHWEHHDPALARDTLGCHPCLLHGPQYACGEAVAGPVLGLQPRQWEDLHEVCWQPYPHAL